MQLTKSQLKSPWVCWREVLTTEANVSGPGIIEIEVAPDAFKGFKNEFIFGSKSARGFIGPYILNAEVHGYTLGFFVRALNLLKFGKFVDCHLIHE